uniref:DDT domain-containing protein n=1 Tax=Odontella aurita TaxID=265563 RepID=A0A7S4JIP1_9STRA|mmetsp:Transcript_47071/g.142547  ORF Transcript_47071/g.142547 Transcript_47071/m.142547 type:complete len:1555 (+) Transcript_47071:97-4761(+)
MADSAAAAGGSAPSEKEVRRKKQAKKMTKIIAKSWNIPGAEPFQDSKHSSKDSIRDLSSVGQKLDAGDYHLGRQGWEMFAGEMGGIYNRHIASKGKYAGAAKRHLEQVKALLAKIDTNLADMAARSVPLDDSVSITKKRKHAAAGNSDVNNHIPKKKHHHHSDRDIPSPAGESMTISQRERRGVELLRKYLEDVGGAREQADSFRCKVVAQSSGEKFNTYYFTPDGRRLKSMVDVARFLSLVKDDKSASSSQSTKGASGKRATIASGRPSNQRQLDAEQRKLKKELEKLMKAHAKATKTLDDHRNDHKNDRYPIEDDVLMEEEGGKLAQLPPRTPDKDGFCGIPPTCVPDVLMVWDFLCTFSRALSLQPIALDIFVSALTYNPQTRSGDHPFPPPVCLAEAHLSLLKLLCGDPSSDEWWWSTLETEETEMQEIAGTNKTRADDPSKPVIKVDLGALLAIEEDSEIAMSWLQALEDVRTRKPNSGAAIKSCVKSAKSITTNPHVKIYLKKSMRQWRGNSAGFTKRAVIWLVDRIREARPDLWGRDVMKEEVEEQKAKVVKEAAMVMHQVDENIDVDRMNEVTSDGESDEDSESSDEEESDDDDDDDDHEGSALEDNFGGSNPRQDEESKPVKSPIPIKPPPALVDLLLPPHKPPPASDLVSPFTWPTLAGASCCRVLHLYKRRRNEVDDSLREFRELQPLSISERRRRERLAPHRVLTECMSTSFNGENNPSETAISHLCKGGHYLDLSPVQRICILRILVEAAYDALRVGQCVSDNIRSRINAVKALELEERRAKRVAREEASAAESAARSRLSQEAKESFLQKKRREIVRNNKVTNEFTAEYIEGLTNEDVAEFDEETKADYQNLPSPQSFNKRQVNAMVAQLQEEEAFNTTSLTILTMEEIESKEKEILIEMEEELNSFGDTDTVYELADRETTAKIDRLKREISNMKENLQSLPPARASAIDALRDAMEDGTIKALKTAIRAANIALLTGIDEETDGVWALDLLRDAVLELKSAEGRKRVTDAQKDLIAKRNKCFVRTEPIGKDRFRNSFWQFDCDQEGRVWVDTNYVFKRSQGDSESSGPFVIDASDAAVGEKDEEGDILVLDPDEDEDKLTRFCRQEYHSSGTIPALVKHHLGCHETDKSLRLLAKNLDSRGLRDGALKAKLKEIIEASVPAGASDEKTDTDGSGKKDSGVSELAGFKNDGDGDHFCNVLSMEQAKEDTAGAIAFDLLQGTKSAIGQKVRIRCLPDPVNLPKSFTYETGTVIGWMMKREQSQNGATAEDESDEGKVPSELDWPVWRALNDSGGEVLLHGRELLESISRFQRWKDGILDEDDPLFSYRNTMGRFCGRAADAPFSSNPLCLSRLMLKKEQEFYTKLKVRSYDNDWGGKSGARNAWIESIKEYGHDLHAVRDGLLTLENAFFELCGGFADMAVDEEGHPPEDARSGKELLDDEKLRVDIELESIGGQIKVLWNSRDSRHIFREIMSSCTTVGFLALGLDLIGRNCQAYLDGTKPVVTRKSTYRQSRQSSFEQPAVTTRRMNAWQQQHLDSLY